MIKTSSAFFFYILQIELFYNLCFKDVSKYKRCLRNYFCWFSFWVNQPHPMLYVIRYMNHQTLPGICKKSFKKSNEKLNLMNIPLKYIYLRPEWRNGNQYKWYIHTSYRIFLCHEMYERVPKGITYAYIARWNHFRAIHSLHLFFTEILDWIITLPR